MTNEEFIAAYGDRAPMRIEGGCVLVDGWLDLTGCTALEALPEGLKVGGSLFLTRCTGLTHWGSRPFRWTMADGFAAQIHSTRRLPDGTSISRASWLRDIAPGKPLVRCYIAERDGETAHGNTADSALRDLAFKIAARDFDPTETVAAIRQRGTVTRQDFRLLTRACEAGLRIGMADAGLDPDAQELPLDVVLAKAHGHFGAKFRERMEA